MSHPLIKPALDLFPVKGERLVGRRDYGLLTHPAAVDSAYRSSFDVIRSTLGRLPKALFAPQHGWFGHTQDNMVEWKSDRHREAGIPIYSLYAEHRKPTPEMLRGIEMMIVDLADIGCRVYTFIQTLKLTMEACAEADIPVLVLNRPNPIGARKEGPMLQPGFESFVGLTSIPLRHGMSMGEIARFYNEDLKLELTVLEYEIPPRLLAPYNEAGLQHGWTSWVMPSPNMPTLDTARVYPGAVILEATNVSEGRGTTRPFELSGSPSVDEASLVKELNSQQLPGVYFRPVAFEPGFQKYSGQLCRGVQIHVLNPAVFEPVLTGTALIQAYFRHDPDFAWKQPPYEYEYEKIPVDIITGSTRFREWIESGRPLSDFREWYHNE